MHCFKHHAHSNLFNLGGEIMGETPDLSKIFEMLSGMNNSQNGSSEANISNQNNFEMPDMETIMKITKLMKSMNSNENSASANLLNSLRPFLRKSKQEKVDQYIRMLKLSSVISELNRNDDKNENRF